MGRSRSWPFPRARFPAVSIWEANRQDNDNAVSPWKPECALIARPYGQVEVLAISAGAHAFLAALAEGRAVGCAIAQGMANTPCFDLAECFDVLISAEAAIALELSDRPPDTHM